MNSKLCKKLRRDAEFRTGNTSTTYHNVVVKKVRCPTGRLHPDGTVATVDDAITGGNTPEFILVDRIKTVMGNCTRKIYKQLKKENRV